MKQRNLVLLIAILIVTSIIFCTFLSSPAFSISRMENKAVFVDDVYLPVIVNEVGTLVATITPTHTPTETPTSTPTPTPTNTAIPSTQPTDGEWKGKTNQGQLVQLEVASQGKILELYGISASDAVFCKVNLVNIIPTTIVNQRFSSQSNGLTFVGQFTAATTATGTYTFVNYQARDINGDACILNISGTWSAEFPSGIPTATPTPGSNHSGQVVFVSQRDGNPEIYTMNANGSDQVRLTSNSAGDSSPIWSPDGTRIVFSSARDGNSEIYVMNADGSGQTRLTNHLQDDFEPSWSPDGSRIVFSSNREGNTNLFIMNADGTAVTRLSPTSSGANSDSDWSPDGTKIVYNKWKVIDDSYEIFVINVDGTGETQLTNSRGYDLYPAWSPDGTKIAFTSSRDGYWQTYVMDAAGTGVTHLLSNSDDLWPRWSPDGQYITFTSSRTGHVEIYVMDADGKNQNRLTDSQAGNARPDWKQ